MKIIRCMKIPGPSNGWCLNPKGLLNGTLSHPFGTPWRVLVYEYEIKIPPKHSCIIGVIQKKQTPSIWGPNPKTSPTSPGPKWRCFSVLDLKQIALHGPAFCILDMHFLMFDMFAVCCWPLIIADPLLGLAALPCTDVG